MVLRILLSLRTALGEESGSCSVNELTKSSRALSIGGSVPYVNFKKMEVAVSFLVVNLLLVGRRYSVDPTSTKTTASA